MLMPVKKLITTSLVSMLVLAPMSASGDGFVVSNEAIYAKGKKQKPLRMAPPGAIAKERKNLNAAHALKSGSGYQLAGTDNNIGLVADNRRKDYASQNAERALGEYVAASYVYSAHQCYGDPGVYNCESPVFQVDADSAATEYDALLYTDATYLEPGVGIVDDAQADFNIAFSAPGGEELGDPALERFHNLLSFGNFGTTTVPDTDAANGDLIDADISDTSLTF